MTFYRKASTVLIVAGLVATLGFALITRPASATTISLSVQGKTGTASLSLSDLQNMTVTQGQSSYQNRLGLWKGVGTYAGVNMASLAALVGGMVPGDTMTVTASDAYAQTFSYYNVYNAWPDASIQGTMILAYSFNGAVVPTWTGGLMAAFLPPDQGYSNADFNATTTIDQAGGSAGSRWVGSVSSIVVNTAPWNVTFKKGASSLVLGGQQITNLTSVTANGSYKKSSGTVVGPDLYTGVNVSYVLSHTVGPMVQTDSLKLISRDNYQQTFNYTVATSTSTLWTILAYKMDGAPLASTDVPRIAFVGPSSPVTTASLWQKAVSSMEIIPNRPPVLQPLTNATGFPYQQLTFTASATDPDGNALRYTWDFGNATPLEVGKTVTHAFAGSGEFTFAVCADDLTGLPGHNVTNSAVASIAFNLTLVAGWNMISVPLIGFGYKASTLPLSPGDVVAEWNSSTQNYLHTYIKGVSGSAQDFSIQWGYGYWIWTPTAKDISVYGSAPTGPVLITLTVPPAGGWVVVSIWHPSGTLHASDIAAMYSGSGSIVMLSYFDAATKSYKSWLSAVPSLNNFVIVPGQAYWVWVTGSGWVSYTA